MDKKEKTKEIKKKLVDTGNQGRKIPNIIIRGKNFGKAVSRHIKNGCEFVEIDEYEVRIEVCNDCEMRNGRICTHPQCGCYLEEKAWWSSESCPLNKW